MKLSKKGVGYRTVRTANLNRGEPINLKLKKNGMTIRNWEFQVLVQKLYKWVQIFVFEFKLKIPQVIIAFNKIRRGTYATYQPGRSGLGTKYTLTLNIKYLKDKYHRILRRLLHELIHCWMELYVNTKPKSKSEVHTWYHSKQFIEKSLSCGIITNHRGYDLGHNEVFSSLLMKYGVDVPETEGEPSEEFEHESSDGSQSKLKKWSRSCTNVWCAVELNAQCLECGEVFEKGQR